MSKVPIELEQLFSKKLDETPENAGKTPEEPTPVATKKKGRAPAGDISIREIILNLFKADETREWQVNTIIERVQVKSPKTPATTIRATVNAIQKAGWIIQKRKEGRSVILVLNPNPSEAPVKPSKPSSGSVATHAAGKRSKAARSDLEVLHRAKDAISDIESLIAKYSKLVEQLSQFK